MLEKVAGYLLADRILTYGLATAVVACVVIYVALVISAYRHGCEVCFWPPRIGPTSNPQQPQPSQMKAA